MSLIVKICGLSTEETLDATLDAGADMVGFVFFDKSPRNIPVARGAALAKRVRGRAEVAVLTVDAADAILSAIVDAVSPDWLQLHGQETPDRVRNIAARFGRRTMKALPVGDAWDLAAADDYRDAADRILLDARPPKGAERPGGCGVPFDWTLLAGFDPGIPYLLSGGLNPANVGEGLAVSHAPGVDVSSGVETAPGVKDPDLIRAFVAAARRAARAPQKVAS